jgi:hypothetical protein
MTPLSDQEVIEQCFAIVSSNGYKGDLPVYDDTMGQWYVTDGDGGYVLPSITELLFNHEFARCLFGEEPRVCSQCERPHDSNMDCDCGGWPESDMPHFQYQLQQLSIASDRINYLRRWLEQRKEQ